MKPICALGLTLLCLLLAACGGDDDAPVQPTSTGNGAPPTAPTETTAPLPEIRLQRVFPSLTFQRLTGLYFQNGRFYALEQVGRIIDFPASGSTEQHAFLDITDRVSTAGMEEGLLGLAFAPDFARSGTFYVYYAAANPRRTILSRFKSANGVADKSSEQVLLEVAQPFPNHKGGQIAFGPDDFLYVGLGDGGSARDPQRNGQNKGALLGKLLRIDVSGADGDRPYRVPADNPFVNDSAARPEIYAWGLRNPWRFSFDSLLGTLWLADVGQDAREEIDVITKGGNYGWVTMEGTQCLDGSNSCDRTGLVSPVLDYANAPPNCSVTGGFVYRGSAIATLRGAYLYADYCSGIIWGLRYNGTQVTEQKQISGGGFFISSFAEDGDGELYVLEHAPAGGIYKIVP